MSVTCLWELAACCKLHFKTCLPARRHQDCALLQDLTDVKGLKRHSAFSRFRLDFNNCGVLLSLFCQCDHAMVCEMSCHETKTNRCCNSRIPLFVSEASSDLQQTRALRSEVSTDNNTDVQVRTGPGNTCLLQLKVGFTCLSKEGSCAG